MLWANFPFSKAAIFVESALKYNIQYSCEVRSLTAWLTEMSEAEDSSLLAASLTSQANRALVQMNTNSQTVEGSHSSISYRSGRRANSPTRTYDSIRVAGRATAIFGDVHGSVHYHIRPRLGRSCFFATFELRVIEFHYMIHFTTTVTHPAKYS